MVPEYLTPNNGGLLSPGQLMGLSHAVFLRYGGLEVAELVLEITPDVMVGKVQLPRSQQHLGPAALTGSSLRHTLSHGSCILAGAICLLLS